MSANKAVTVLRSPSPATASGCSGAILTDEVCVARTGDVALCDASCAPQLPQNFSLGSFDAPQPAHLAANGAPHSAQNRRPSRLSVPHFAQTIRLKLRVRQAVIWRR